ncbi:hypothetical protein B0T26DRAFT_388015 [Lasiosphaeria miniovina]|uniref:BTB domain-containing protein n=1 Tax=Lasiosphaeria miniovina TaxID=1954250 RepID=A0AA40A4G0_9PEZI|nr:uncharacterized protein B0T26DRAFT_388015 [Lasiosphaeria miniovina]KAK0708958.1 hypothetical protein B0T26DRAFT_388015 [Lasiosphaeria miniovina]
MAEQGTAGPLIVPEAPLASDKTGETDNWLKDRIVNVYVGAEEKRWAVHEKLLSSKSLYFDRVFNGRGDIKGRNELRMPTADPRLFALLVRWLYGTAFATSGGTRMFRFPLPDGKDITVRDYLGLYVLGGKIDIIGVRNAVINALYLYWGAETDEVRCPSLHDVQYVFANTDAKSHMRRLILAHALFYLFGRKRRGDVLLAEWEDVLKANGEIGWSMISMLADWRWVMGINVPGMKIKPRQDFHEPLVEATAPSSQGQESGMVKGEPEEQ